MAEPLIRPRAAIGRMRRYQPPLEGRAGTLRLDFNERTSGPPAVALAAVRDLSPASLAAYPEYRTARQRLARFFHRPERELVVTCGTDDALHLVVDTFVERGDPVLVIEPTYAMYRFYAERAGARVRALRWEPGCPLPLTGLMKALNRHPRVLFLASPNNPTGAVATRAEIAALLSAAPRTLMVVDEAYVDFGGTSVLPWVGRNPNLAVTRTFSKAWGLAGLRLGCLFAGAPTAAALARAHSPYSVNSAALAAALAAITRPDGVRSWVESVVRNRTRLLAALRHMGIRAFPSAGNFVLVDVGRRATMLVSALSRRGILVRDRRSDFSRPGFVRITVGSDQDTRRLLTALEELGPCA